jgi:hypothetical protein
VLRVPQRASAQDESAPEVARISLVQGSVSTLRGDSKDWIAATANAPLTRGDVIATGPTSRAEIQLDDANVLRLDQTSEAQVADLTRRHILVQVASGLVNFEVRGSTQANVEIDAPNMAIRIGGEGAYRLQVLSPDYALFTVCRGRAEVLAGRGSMNVASGQVIYIKGRADPDYQMAQAPARDAWDRWNDERGHTIADAQAWKYTSRYYTGSEDLDRYGDWVQVPGYGWCWTPYADAGWVPYRKGRWVSDTYYEWIWVGYEPWGWAPYHYGRWICYDDNWCWWPGVAPGGVRSDWAPGYVAFFGLGGHPGGPESGAEFNSIGWCPLGPRDKFVPWWSHGQTLSITDIASLNAVTATEGPAGPDYGSNLQGILTNLDLRGAVTTLSVENFANGRTGHDLYPVNATLLEQGSLIQGPLPVTPTKSSLRPVERSVNRAALPPAADRNLQLFTRNVGPAPRPSDATAPINSKAGVQRPAGRVPPPAGSLAPAMRQEIAGAQPNPTIAGQIARPGNDPPDAHPGWRRFTWNKSATRPPADLNKRDSAGTQPAAPPALNAPPRPLEPATQDPNKDSGWRHFSPPPTSADHGGGATSPNQGGLKRAEPPPNGSSSAPREEQYKI